MPKLNFEIRNTATGVVVDVDGDLGGLSDAAWVARMMIDVVEGLFCSGQPVLLAGDADPVCLQPKGVKNV